MQSSQAAQWFRLFKLSSIAGAVQVASWAVRIIGDVPVKAFVVVNAETTHVTFQETALTAVLCRAGLNKAGNTSKLNSTGMQA